MTKGRLEAFSDGVLAIIITIMVLELRAPHAPSWSALANLFPIFLSYVLSFIYVGIYWNNHHHLLHAAERISGTVMWANMFLLFCLSLIPFATAWMGESHFAVTPVAFYGGVLFFSAIAYSLLVRSLLGIHAKNSPLSSGIGSDVKGKVSMIIYALGMVLTSVLDAKISCGLYVLVAILWLVPDKRLEHNQ